jgi:hypothetical protein
MVTPPCTPRTNSAGLGIVFFFAFTTLQSAFLIFLVQPMVGKQILPWFGGVPTVWSLCLAFYQTTIFAGYAYAHWLQRRIRPAIQIAVHGGIFSSQRSSRCRYYPTRRGGPRATKTQAGPSPPCWLARR